jgi:hypothetical protein
MLLKLFSIKTEIHYLQPEYFMEVVNLKNTNLIALMKIISNNPLK